MGRESGGIDPARIVTTGSEESRETCFDPELLRSFGFFLKNFEKANPDLVMMMMKGDYSRAADRKTPEFMEVEDDGGKERIEGMEAARVSAKVSVMEGRVPEEHGLRTARVPAVVNMEADGVKEGGGTAKAAAGAEEPSMAARASCATVKEGEGVFGLGLSGNILSGPGLGLDGKANLDDGGRHGLGLSILNGQPMTLHNSSNKVTSSNSLKEGTNGPSYASVVNKQASKAPSISLNNIPDPIIRGEKIIVEIPDELVDRCMSNASFDLIGRIQYRKGEKPLPLLELKNKIQTCWKITNDWKLAPIGRGYFYCRFFTNEDKMKAWAMPWLKTNPGIFKLSKWVKDFNPYNHIATTSNVWIRMFGLSGEIFNPEVMIRIAKGVGTPILVDKASSNFDYAHFGRVLVEVDLADKLPTSVFINMKGIEKEIEIQYENLPSFCDHCSLIGHDKLDCRNLIKLLDEKRRKEDNHRRKRSSSRTRFVPVAKNNPVGPVEENMHKDPVEENKEGEKDNTPTIPCANKFNCLNMEEPADEVEKIIEEEENRIEEGKIAPISPVSPNNEDPLNKRVECVELKAAPITSSVIGVNSEDSLSGEEDNNSENGDDYNSEEYEDEEEEEEEEEEVEDSFYLHLTKENVELNITKNMDYVEILNNIRKFLKDAKQDERGPIGESNLIGYIKDRANKEWRDKPNFHDLWAALNAVNSPTSSRKYWKSVSSRR